jgi:predicted enzyme related to lactoylglutathione lyase
MAGIFLNKTRRMQRIHRCGDSFCPIGGSVRAMATDATTARELVHLELHTTNLGRACAFYCELLDWRPRRIELAGTSYQALEVGGKIDAGVVECGTTRALWLPYVEVSSVAAATERACGLGARVLLGPREGPAGWRSVISAPACGEVALWEPKPGSAGL